MGQRLSHPVQEWFAADKAMIRQHVSPAGHMFTAAKTDLEMQRAGVAKQALGRHRPFGGHGDLG